MGNVYFKKTAFYRLTSLVYYITNTPWHKQMELKMNNLVNNKFFARISGTMIALLLVSAYMLQFADMAFKMVA
jgi:hypothetical protein